MSRLARLLRGAGLLLVLLAALSPTAALAHERRPVGGKYQFVVGFLSEPAIANQMNGIDLRVTNSSDNNKPVEGLEKTLKAEVIVGGGAHKMSIDLQARFGQPGAYDGYFIPTREGSYIFHFTGTIEGTPIDERFESGPGRFDDVQTADSLQFPDKLPDTLAAVNQANAARDEAASARTFGIAGLVVGAVGLIVGGVALVTRRRPEKGVESH
jgi:hypothetical protein